MGRKATCLELRHFAALVALADTGGVSKAARQLGVAQSTLSETLLSLERALCRPVLERIPGAAAALTDVARRLLPHARSILQATDRAQAEALAVPMRLVIGTVESIGTHSLPAALEACRSAHPHLEVQVTVGLCDSLKALFAAGRIDLLLTMERATARGNSPRLPKPTVPLMLLRGGVATSDPILDTWPLLIPDPEGALHEAALRWLRCEGTPRRLVSTGTLDGVRRGMDGGSVLGLLPRHAALDDLRNGRFSVVAPGSPLPSLELRMRLRRTAQTALREAASTIMSALSQQLDLRSCASER